MVKTNKLSFVIVALLIVVLFILPVAQRQRQDVLMEMLILPFRTSGSAGGGAGYSAFAYSFVVSEDRMLISRVGISNRNFDVTRNNNMWLTLRRSTRSLSEEEFQNISVWLDELVENYMGNTGDECWAIWGIGSGKLLYNGHIYNRMFAHSNSFNYLLRMFMQRTPFIFPFFMN